MPVRTSPVERMTHQCLLRPPSLPVSSGRKKCPSWPPSRVAQLLMFLRGYHVISCRALTSSSESRVARLLRPSRVAIPHGYRQVYLPAQIYYHFVIKVCSRMIALEYVPYSHGTRRICQASCQAFHHSLCQPTCRARRTVGDAPPPRLSQYGRVIKNKAQITPSSNGQSRNLRRMTGGRNSTYFPKLPGRKRTNMADPKWLLSRTFS